MKNFIKSVSISIYKCLLHCQCQECNEIFIVLPAKPQRDLNLQKIKYNKNPHKIIQTVKRRCDDNKHSVKQHIKEKYIENRTSNIVYKKAKDKKNHVLPLLQKMQIPRKSGN